MKYLDEYRNEALAQKVVGEIRRVVTRPWVLMEVCGGQTHTIVKYGIDHLLPPEVELVHGPGCPVCVTSLEMIDKAHAIARRPDVIFTSFGDMLRVPGSDCDLLVLKSRGADIRVVYSPIDALKIARANPNKKVVFFAIGFETTAPGNAMAVWQAHQHSPVLEEAFKGLFDPWPLDSPEGQWAGKSNEDLLKKNNVQVASAMEPRCDAALRRSEAGDIDA